MSYLTLMKDSESLRKGYKRAGVKTLRRALRGLEFTDDDFDIDNLGRDEIIEIIENYMEFKDGGLATKKRAGHTDYRKTGLFK